MKLESLPVDFTDEQKRYLEGLAAGVQIMRSGRGLGSGATTGNANAEPTGPWTVERNEEDIPFSKPGCI